MFLEMMILLMSAMFLVPVIFVVIAFLGKGMAWLRRKRGK